MYSTSFQCPATGQMVTAHFAFGKVTIVITDDIPVDAETQAATAEWVQRHSGKRFSSLAAADEYVVNVADGQTFGFESSRY